MEPLFRGQPLGSQKVSPEYRWPFMKVTNARLDEHFFRTKVFSSLNKGVLKERFYCSLRNFLHFLYSLPVLLIQCAGAWAVLLLSFEKSICWLLSCFELFFSLNLNSCSSLEEPDLISLFSVVGDNKTVKILSRKQNCIHTERWKHSTWEMTDAQT